MMHKGFFLAGLLAIAAPLAGCLEDGAPKPAAQANDGAAGRVTTAAQQQVRGIARDANALRFRAVETYRQAMAGTYAVCGQATVGGDAVYIPFVSVVNTAGGRMEVEQYVARTNIEATRVYGELVSRCFEGGGPVQRAGGVPVSQPTPPLPNGLPVLDQATPEPAKPSDLLTTVAAPGGASSSAGGVMVMRQNGNVRSSPGGGGAVLRVARSGSTLNIFGTAPGGWYQVGDTGPEGWVHGSMGTAQTRSLASVASVQ